MKKYLKAAFVVAAACGAVGFVLGYFNQKSEDKLKEELENIDDDIEDNIFEDEEMPEPKE